MVPSQTVGATHPQGTDLLQQVFPYTHIHMCTYTYTCAATHMWVTGSWEPLAELMRAYFICYSRHINNHISEKMGTLPNFITQRETAKPIESDCTCLALPSLFCIPPFCFLDELLLRFHPGGDKPSMNPEGHFLMPYLLVPNRIQCYNSICVSEK